MRLKSISKLHVLRLNKEQWCNFVHFNTKAPSVWSACETQNLNFIYWPTHSVDSTQLNSSLQGVNDHRHFEVWLSNKDFFKFRVFFPLVDTTCNLKWNSWKCRASVLLCSKYSLNKNWVQTFPDSDVIYKWIYENSYIWTSDNDVNIWLIIAVMHTT